MDDKIILIFKRIPVIIGFIMLLVGIVAFFGLPYALIPLLTEPAEEVNNDFDPGTSKFGKYVNYGEFTISGTITEEDEELGVHKYYLDNSDFFISSKEDIGDKDDFVLLNVEVTEDQTRNEDYLSAQGEVNPIVYNIPGMVIVIIGALLLLFGLAKKTPEERATHEKAIARKRALDKELDILERDLQTTIGPAPGMPGGPQPGMPPGQMPPGQMPPGQMPPGQMPPGQMPPGQGQPGVAQPGVARPMVPPKPGVPPTGVIQQPVQPQKPAQKKE